MPRWYLLHQLHFAFLMRRLNVTTVEIIDSSAKLQAHSKLASPLSRAVPSSDPGASSDDEDDAPATTGTPWYYTLHHIAEVYWPAGSGDFKRR